MIRPRIMKLAATRNVGDRLPHGQRRAGSKRLQRTSLSIFLGAVSPDTRKGRDATHWMRKGIRSRTFRLDHSRADHPITSPMPQHTAVSRSHHRR